MNKKILLTSCLIFSLATPSLADSDDLSSWTSETTSSTPASQGCNPTIAKAIADSQNSQIKGRQTAAKNLYEAVLGSMAYRAASCLDSLLPNFSTGNFGSGLDQIASIIANAACSYAEKMLGPTISDYNSTISSGESFLTNKMQVPGVAGLNFGTIVGFQNTNINATGYLGSVYKQNVPNWDYQTNADEIIQKNTSGLFGDDFTMDDYRKMHSTEANF